MENGKISWTATFLVAVFFGTKGRQWLGNVGQGERLNAETQRAQRDEEIRGRGRGRESGRRQILRTHPSHKTRRMEHPQVQLFRALDRVPWQDYLCRIERNGLGIGDFAEDGGAFRACGAWKIGGAVVEGFVGEEGEGVGFFGVFRHA